MADVVRSLTEIEFALRPPGHHYGGQSVEQHTDQGGQQHESRAPSMAGKPEDGHHGDQNRREHHRPASAAVGTEQRPQHHKQGKQAGSRRISAVKPEKNGQPTDPPDDVFKHQNRRSEISERSATQSPPPRLAHAQHTFQQGHDIRPAVDQHREESDRPRQQQQVPLSTAAIEPRDAGANRVEQTRLQFSVALEKRPRGEPDENQREIVGLASVVLDLRRKL